MDESVLKVPPHSIEAERAVLGGIIKDNRKFLDVEEVLTSEMFYARRHSVIYERMWSMAMERKPIDCLSLIESLNDAGTLDDADGYEYVVDVSESGYSTANIMHYAEIVKTRYQERKIIMAGMDIQDAGWSDSGLQEKVDQAQKIAMDLTPGTFSETKSVNQAMQETIAEIDRRFNAGDSMLGVPSGFKDLDSRTKGFMDGDLIVVAGRPGMGKSAIAANIAEHNVLEDRLVIFFSLEMPTPQLMQRSIASVGRIPFDLVRNGKAAAEYPEQLTSAAARFKDKNYYIDDNTGLTSGQVLSRSRKIAQKAERKPDLVIIDYLQLLNDKSKGEETQRITEISRNIKLAARELNCPVILLSQLNRGVESNKDKRPTLAHLRSSGAIEQDADLVMMLYRDEAYNEDTNQSGVAEVIIRKFRNGETGTVFLASMLGQCRFGDLTFTPAPIEETKASKFEY